MQRDGDDYLTMYPRYLQWINQCVGCQRRGYKPDMPADLQPNIQRRFQPLELREDGLCEQCAAAGSQTDALPKQSDQTGGVSRPTLPTVSLTDKAVTRFVLAAFLTSVGLWLFMDSLTFGLSPADPETGRARGCYTWLEDVLGAKEPSDRLRQTQRWAGGMMTIGIPAMLSWSAIHRRRLRRAENRN